MRAGWRFLAFAGVLISILSGCGPKADAPPGSQGVAGGGGKRFIIVMNGNSPFWDAVRAGMDDAAKQLGVTAVLEPNDGTPAGQINILRQFASQSDIAAVGISATDAANSSLVDEMRKLQKKGVHVITVDSDVDREKFRDARFAFIGTDNAAAGRELGIAARELRPDGGKFVTFVGRTGAQNAIERVGGFAEGAGAKFKSVDNMGDENDRTRARENVRNAIRNHPDLNTLVGIWSYNAPAIADVVRELRVRNQFCVVAFDAEAIAIKHMQDGDIDAMIVQNPFQMGFQGIRLMKALAEDDQATIGEMFPKHGQTDGDLYDTGLKMVVPDEGSVLKAEMFGPSTEFLRLGDFRKWLAKYGLSSS